MGNLNEMVVDDSNEGIKATIAELNATLKAFKSLSGTIEGMVKQNENKIALLLDNFEETSSNLNALSAELKEAGLSNTLNNLDNTLLALQETLAKVDNPTGTVGKLLNDDALYNNLESATKELEMLLLDIKLHPARYRRILSKKEIPYEEPTEQQKN
jgi:phospholipid/cholesterol/gamma-HCH transport system substrate-binding protein